MARRRRRRGAAPGSGGWGRERVRVSGRGSPGGGWEEAVDPQHRLVALVVAAAEGAQRAPDYGWVSDSCRW